MEFTLPDIDDRKVRLNVPNYAKRALELLERNNYEAYIVGGWVRDALMGKVAQDIDISTSALWQEVIQVFKDAGYSVYETGTQHGTVSVNVDGNIIEITTFREESGYEDSRHPDEVRFVDSIDQDLKRRDFTINAMAYNPKTGLIDLFGGVEDIKNKKLRCVGDPLIRFDEDALRILRAVRFSTRLGFKVEATTRKALTISAHKLKAIAKERIGSELSSIVSSGKLSFALRDFPDVMVAAVPELNAIVGFDQKTHFHAYDCYEHTIRVVANCEITTGSYPLDALRWAAFWHDIAKPECMYIDSFGEGHFPDHPEVSSIKARNAMKKMALPTELIRLSCALIREHDEPLTLSRISMIRMLQRLASYGVKKENLFAMGYAVLYLRQADALAKAIEYRSYVSKLEKYKTYLQEIERIGIPITVGDLAIGGKDVLDIVGIKPGPKVGEILSICLEEVIQGNICVDRDSQLAWLSTFSE